MPGLSGLALTTEQFVEVISMYVASAGRVDAVEVAPGWHIIGPLPVPATANIRFDLLGSVSDESLVLSARLYCVTPGFVGVVPGSSVQLSSTIDVEQFSGEFTLVGNRIYQVWAQVVGAAGDDYFGRVSRAAPTGA